METTTMGYIGIIGYMGGTLNPTHPETNMKTQKGPIKITVLLNGYFMGFHVSLGECKLGFGSFSSMIPIIWVIAPKASTPGLSFWVLSFAAIELPIYPSPSLVVQKPTAP